MSCFVSRKKGKIQAVFSKLGASDEKAHFISLYKEVYTDNWRRICEKWQEEKGITTLGKKHPMQPPGFENEGNA